MKFSASTHSHAVEPSASAEWLSREQFLAGRDFYPAQLSPEDGTLLMVELSRGDMKSMPFHNKRSTVRGRKTYRVEIDRLRSWLSPGLLGQNPSHYIFHNAYCGSTLLARCLDIPACTRVYREPSTLATLGDWLHQDAANSGPVRRHAEMLLTLLQRDGEQTVIKLNDRSNNMAASLLELHPASRGILLYSELPDFLVAVLGKPARRQWLQERCALGCASLSEGLTVPPDLPVSRDGEAAARYWLAQMLYFSDCLRHHPSRVLPLHSGDFLDEPLTGSRTAADFLGLDLQEDVLLENIAAERQTHAKMGQPYRRHEAALRKAMLEKTHAAEITQAVQWMDALLQLNGMHLPILKSSVKT